jgi:hypothetical protein
MSRHRWASLPQPIMLARWCGETLLQYQLKGEGILLRLNGVQFQIFELFAARERVSLPVCVASPELAKRTREAAKEAPEARDEELLNARCLSP